MNENKNYYVTTPIYYVNDKPHIGHFYTTLACDVIARFKRLDGYNVIFATGTDEHGQKIEEKAKLVNIPVEKMVNILSKTFKDMFDSKEVNFTYDDFVRTTEERHIKNVQYIWKELHRKGFIYKDSYEGYYSISDEAFYTDSELIKKDDGSVIAKNSGSKVEKIKEESYFFKLSNFQNDLLKYYNDNPSFIAPKGRYNEVISFVKSGLRDLSISRIRIKWGIKVPSDQNHIIYVWLDALSNYLTILGYPNINDNVLFKNFWPANLHLIGKDILRFHAVYWPAFLMALDLPLPKRIFAHGWWTNMGEKISKSRGNIIDPIPLINKYGADELKYFLLREIPFGNDGDFNEDYLISRINNELANDYGNLVQRTLAIINKYFNNNIFYKNSLDTEQNEILNKFSNILKKLRILINNQDFHSYLDEIWLIIRYLNSYINKTIPWELIKNKNFEKAEKILYTIVESIKNLSIFLLPILPNSASKILDQLNYDKSKRNFKYINSLTKEYNINTASPIFKKYINNQAPLVT